MTQMLNTRIVLRNDSTANWLDNSTQILLKGEIGIEFLLDNKVKVKIGDGLTAWQDLNYFGYDLFVGDNASVAIENGVAKLYGYDAAPAGAQLVKGTNGTLEWILPDNTTLENLKITVATLRTDIDALAALVGTPASETEAASGLYSELEKKANKNDVYTKEEINNLIGTVYKYRGSKTHYADLPNEGQQIGDVWNIINGDFAHGILPGDNVAWNGVSWDKLSGTVDLSNYATLEQVEELAETVEAIPNIYLTKNQGVALFERKDYEISNVPAGTLVDYRDKEIRVMCPKDTEWTKQNVGPTGNANMYYMAFKAYAPEGAVSFKEGDQGVIEDEMFTFDDDFAGTDLFGRNYSIVWLPLASYDASTDTWTYFGKNSSNSRYIGWNYVVEWYDANGKVMASDMIRISLSNEDCHLNLKHSYLSTVNVNDLVQDEGDVLVLYGGSSEANN